jgi:hypothetical protein
VTIFQAVLALVLLQRGGELILARANTLRLLKLAPLRSVAPATNGSSLHAAWLTA